MNTELPGSASATDYEVPLEMLAACRLRIESQCTTLQRLAQHLLDHGSDALAQADASRLKRYFDMSAMDLHADEEVDLFPALIESVAGSDAVCLRGLIVTLSTEHRELESRWRSLRVVLQKVARGMSAALDVDDVSGFVRLYQRHIAREQAELLPMARRLLGSDELDRIATAMRARRKVIGNPPARPTHDRMASQ
ncbi:MAG TPA: hemerythrin domain-containing protein [Rubrivivax sp.]